MQVIQPTQDFTIPENVIVVHHMLFTSMTMKLLSKLTLKEVIELHNHKRNTSEKTQCMH